MENIFLLLICFSLGVALRQSGKLPDSTPSVLNGFIIYISLPSLAIIYLHDLPQSTHLIVPVVAPWLLFAFSFILVTVVGKLYRWSPALICCLVLLTGLGNTSFLGLPMLEAFLGKSSLPIGILIDQLGSFLILSSAGVALCLKASGGNFSNTALLRRIITFPPFLAVIAGLTLIQIPFTPVLSKTLERLGGTLTPLALFSVGFQLKLSSIRTYRLTIAVFLMVKMILFPVIIALLLHPFTQNNQNIFRVTVFEMAMPPMITAAVLAQEYQLEAELASGMVAIGFLAAFITLPLWNWVLISAR